MEKSELKDLLQKFSVGKCTKEEALWVENWYIQQNTHGPLPVSDEEFQNQLKSIYDRLPSAKKSRANLNWMKVAAVLSFLVLSIGIYSYFKKDTFIENIEYSFIPKDIAPGGNKATLTLADGTEISLDQMEEGEIYQNNNLSIRKTKDGEIEYLNSSDFTSVVDQPPVFNYIATPHGGKYQITLHDGSRIWLNASSSLKYPTNFSSSERVVELEGEAYFEIAKSTIPFYVITDNQRIEVLGTQFNVNAYKSTPTIKTTLIEGSVKVSFNKDKDAEKDLILKPGEEAVLIKNETAYISKVNVKQAIAWKDGFFHFEGTDLESAMHEFSRWYGVDVEFEGVVPNTKLWGKINRNVPASQALSILEYFDLKFNVIESKGVSKIEISKKD